MKVKIIRATIAQKRQVYPGETLEVSREEAVQLIGAGKAEAVKAEAETTQAPMANVETAKVPDAEKPKGKKVETAKTPDAEKPKGKKAETTIKASKDDAEASIVEDAEKKEEE